MLRTRAVFKQALKKCKEEKEVNEANAIGRAYVSGDNKNFWKNVKMVKGDNIHSTVTTINSSSGSGQIRDMWRNHFESLLNSNKSFTKIVLYFTFK